MAADKKDPRSRLSQELEAIRSKIVREELVLFVGEELSTLVTPENQSPSLDDWWQIVNHPSEDGIKALMDLEEGYLARYQLAPPRVHSALRNVGKFPLIITTNMDELLERFLWKTGNGGEKIRLDQISCLAKSWPYLRRDVVIKCLGDAGFIARVLPSSKKYFEDFCDRQENAEVEFMRQLFNERSILFLGCDPNRVEYVNFFRKFAVNAKEMKHYKFETHSEPGLKEDGNLLTLKANLQPWEFVQFLSPGTIEEKIQPGIDCQRSYLRHQRAEYLQQQLVLEKMASEIVFHTISITNALASYEFIDEVSRPTIENIYKEDPFGGYSDEKVQRALDAMTARFKNLTEMIEESKTKVIALFFYHGVKNEIELWRKEAQSEEEKQKNLEISKISIRKYTKAILLCKSFLRNKSSLEIRIVGDQETYNVEEVEKETFALIRLKGGQDEAICYAETATSPQSRKFANHLININGEEVLNKRRIYEKSRANAWSNEDSIFKLANALTKENDEIQKQGLGISAIDKDDLEMLETLARVSLKVRSQLDLSSFKRLGTGSYGEVFKAEKEGKPVAVKILKNVENVKQIEYYEREVDLLRVAKHTHIVGVIGCLAIDNSLAIVMELVNGGNLKQFLKNDLHGAGKKEFTVRFVEHIGSAIEHLHSLDIIHRDVKPDNILLSEDHKVLKLGDFGLARATEGTEQTKTMMGSYRYMAPEVRSALRGHYSKRADVYSFGLCLIEVLSQGKDVFAHIANDKDVMDRKADGEKPDIPEISVEEFGEELATRLKVITEECLRPESSRPEMSGVLGMLRGELTTNKNTVRLYRIGTGTGTTGRGDEKNVTKNEVYAFKNCLVTAQNMLAEIYGNNYPLSKTVEEGLQTLLDQEYNGKLDDFMTNFITPTETLLRRAKDEGFSLVKDGLVIIHLVAPTDHLENAEMFYQVGHTSPGVLAVKFTKYQGRNVIQQAGSIDDEELHGAFTQRYLERLRAEAPDLGDQLMRILLTSKENVSGDYDVEKVEVKKTMPRSLDESFRCHPPVTETAMPKSPGDDEQPVLSRSCSEDQGTSCIVTGHDCPSQEGSSLTNKDLSSSLLAQAPSGDHMASAVAFPSQHQEQLGENVSYPKYPPLLHAVKYGIEEPDIGGQTSQDGQSKAKYPPLREAVRNKTEEPDTGQPCGEHPRPQSSLRYSNNPQCSPLSPASGNDQTPTLSSTTVGSEPYPPLVQAVNDQQVARATGQLPPLTGTSTGGTGTYREDEDLDLF